MGKDQRYTPMSPFLPSSPASAVGSLPSLNYAHTPGRLDTLTASIISSASSRPTPPVTPPVSSKFELNPKQNPPVLFHPKLLQPTAKSLIKPHPHLGHPQQKQKLHRHNQPQYNNFNYNCTHIRHQKKQQKQQQQPPSPITPSSAPSPAPRTPDVRHQLYLYHEQVITALAGKDRAYARAHAKATATSSKSIEAAHDLIIVIQTEAQLAGQVRQLERNKLKKTFFPLKTSDDIARLRHRLSAVSAEVLVAKSRGSMLRRRARDEQATANSLRGDAQLLDTSERARQQILADSNYFQQQQRYQQHYHPYQQPYHPQSSRKKHQSSSMKFASQAKMPYVHTNMNMNGVSTPSNTATSSLSSVIDDAQFMRQTSSIPSKGGRLLSDLQYTSNSKLKRNDYYHQQYGYVSDDGFNQTMSELYSDRLAKVTRSAQESLSAQLETRRLLIKSHKLLMEVRRRLWDAFISASNKSDNSSYDTINYSVATSATGGCIDGTGNGNNVKMGPAVVSTNITNTKEKSILLEFKWAVWQAREAGKRIERAIVLADKLPIRKLVQSWYGGGAFLDLSDVLVDQASTIFVIRVTVERSVRIVDSVCDSLKDSIEMQDGLIDILREGLVRSNTTSTTTNTFNSTVGDDDNDEMNRDEEFEDQIELDRVINDVVRMRSDLAHQHLHFPPSSTSSASTFNTGGT